MADRILTFEELLEKISHNTVPTLVPGSHGVYVHVCSKTCGRCQADALFDALRGMVKKWRAQAKQQWEDGDNGQSCQSAECADQLERLLLKGNEGA